MGSVNAAPRQAVVDGLVDNPVVQAMDRLLTHREAAWPVEGRRDPSLLDLADGVILVDAGVPAMKIGLRSLGEVVPAYGRGRETLADLELGQTGRERAAVKPPHAVLGTGELGVRVQSREERAGPRLRRQELDRRKGSRLSGQHGDRGLAEDLDGVPVTAGDDITGRLGAQRVAVNGPGVPSTSMVSVSSLVELSVKSPLALSGPIGMVMTKLATV